jgi:hypothetical protein
VCVAAADRLIQRKPTHCPVVNRVHSRVTSGLDTKETKDLTIYSILESIVPKLHHVFREVPAMTKPTMVTATRTVSSGLIL